MNALERPLLRRLGGRRVDHQGRSYVILEDPHGLFEPRLFTLDGYRDVLRHFDGRNSLDEIAARVRGPSADRSALRALVTDLDRAMVLDGPTFAAFLAEYRRQETRPAALAGRSYPRSSPALRGQLTRHFLDPRGAGLPDRSASMGTGRLRAVLSPHIDFARGGHVYSHAYRALAEHCDAEVFVVLGVAHQGSRHRFALTRKDFETPIGPVATDRAFVDRLLDLAGDHLLDDELTHRTEHSIEFQAVFLRHLLDGRPPFSIVPILVGSFHDLMAAGREPIDDPEVGRFVAALREAESSCGKRVAYIGAIDLAHVGPEFGDEAPVSPETQEEVRRFDRAMLDRAIVGDASGWFATAGAVADRWRVCGLAATYTILHAIGPSARANGTLLRYDQAIDRARTCCVTFAGVAYHDDRT